MDYSANNEKGNGIVLEFRPFIRVYRDGRLERLLGTDTVPAGLDPQTGVDSKDVNIDAHVSLSARLYLPKLRNPDGDEKFPILIFFHGGGFCVETASSPTYHNYINLVASEASVVVVSVDYRKAPEYPLPVAYDDSWAAVKWVESHARGHRPVEPWLNDHVDYRRVFFTGDSAGGNIAHHMAIGAGI